MTEKITDALTEGQNKQIRRFLQDAVNAITVDDITRLGLSKDGAQEIIKNGNILQNRTRDFAIGLLKELSIEDKRYGQPIIFEFTAPADYKHDSQIDDFAKKTKSLKTTHHYNDALTSENFAKATNKLQPGKTYKAKIFPILATVTSEDNMNFLRKQNAILVGGQGLTLVQSLKPDEFPVNKYTVSFDEKEALWKDSDGFRRVPIVHRRSGGGWDFDLGCFEDVWGSGACLFCVCDK